MFAEDVKVQARPDYIMDELLKATTEWVVAHGMTWNTKKCAILRKEGSPLDQTTTIQGQAISNYAEAEYLGVTATASGNTESAMMRRV